MILRIVSVIVILAGSLFGQARVGTNPELGFLGFPPSVRSAGMGLVGVMLPDGDAGHYNPALPALDGSKYFSISFNPGSSEVYGLDQLAYASEQITARVPLSQASPFSVALGYGHVGLTIGPIIETTYDQGVDIGDRDGMYIEDDTRAWTLSVLWQGPVQVAAGAGVRKIESKAPDYSMSGRVGDLGFAMRIPVNRTASMPTSPSVPRLRTDLLLGLSFQNYGPDIEYQYGLLERLIQGSLRSPKTGRWGFGLQMSYGSGYHDWLRILPVFEKQLRYSSDRDPEYRFGLEVGLAELFYLRLGRVDRAFEENSIADDHNTIGVAVSTAGLRKLIVGDNSGRPGRAGFGYFVLDNLNLELSFARVDPFPELFDPTDYYALRLTL